MSIRITQHFLHKLEDLIAETDYTLRYEKGNFKSGYCMINDDKVAIVNKYYSLEGKINSLIEIIKSINPDPGDFSEKNKKLYLELAQTELEI